MSLTKTLGQFIADLSPNRLPEEAQSASHAWASSTASAP